jgi:hypothetical protein
MKRTNQANPGSLYTTGIVPILADMLKERDMYIRQQLALCFKHLAEGIASMDEYHKSFKNIRGNCHWCTQGLQM